MADLHSHSHSHKHSHSHTELKGTNLLISILLNILITASQIVGGIISGSLALLSDALHNFSDVLSLVVSYIANILSKKEASIDKTFGYKRAEILAAFINASTLIIVAIILIIEAIKRFQNPEPIESNLVIWLSLLGILANGFSVLLLKKDAKKNINMRSAYLHLFTDMMASIAVLIGGLLIKYYDILWVDSLLTLLIALYLIWVGLDLFKESIKVLMLFTPNDLHIKDIVEELCIINEVKNVHHIHVWQLNEEETHFEAHIDFINNIKLSDFVLVLNQIEDILLNKFQINHVNIQPEFDRPGNKDIIVQD